MEKFRDIFKPQTILLILESSVEGATVVAAMLIGFILGVIVTFLATYALHNPIITL